MTDTSTAMNQILRRGCPNAQEEQRERGVAPEELRALVLELKKKLDSQAEQLSSISEVLNAHDEAVQALGESVQAMAGNKQQGTQQQQAKV